MGKSTGKQILGSEYICLLQNINQQETQNDNNDEDTNSEETPTEETPTDPNKKYRNPLLDTVSAPIWGEFQIKYKNKESSWITMEEFTSDNILS